jgi:HK97 family phage prohead protease
MPEKGELRTKEFALEIKAADPDGTIRGYASMFDERDSMGDIVVSGAFAKSLDKTKASGRQLPMLWQHISAQPLGPWTEITEDDKGLAVTGRLLIDAVERAREAYALAKERVITGLSIGFRLLDWEWSGTLQAILLKEIDLWEVSLVTFPALDSARITDVKKRLGSEVDTKRDFERFLRDAGFSRQAALCLASGGWDALDGRRDTDIAAATRFADSIRAMTRT